jgi:hypothetical protein
MKKRGSVKLKIHGKRPLKIFLSCLLCLGLLLTAVPALAADNCRVTVSSAQGETGEEVNITVSIENPSGMAGGSLNLFYDPQVVSPVQATRGTAAKGQFVSNLGYQKAGKNAVRVVWASSTGTSTGGELFSVSFKIIGPGSSALTISDLTITNASLQQIAASVTHGSIINTAAPPPGEQDNTGSSGNSESGSGTGNSSNSSGTAGPSAGNITVNIPHTTASGVMESDLPSLKDIQAHWASSYINRLVGMKVINGYADGTFKPEKNISRAEFAKVIALALSLPLTDEPELNFADQKEIPAWSRPYIAAAVQAGIINGYEDKTFRASANITRAEIAVMIVRAMQEQAPAGAQLNFTDAATIPAWAAPYIKVAADAGIITGKPNRSFAPSENATRAEAATMTAKMLSSLGI